MNPGPPAPEAGTLSRLGDGPFFFSSNYCFDTCYGFSGFVSLGYFMFFPCFYVIFYMVVVISWVFDSIIYVCLYFVLLFSGWLKFMYCVFI